MMLASLIDLPPVTQSTPSNCGAACVTSVLRYYGENAFEQDIAKELGTKEEGTTPASIVRVVRDHKLRCDARSNRSMRSLRRHIANGSPVIVLVRSQGGISHYVVVVGFDDDDVTFFDPWTGRNTRRGREDFKERWTHSGDDEWCRWGLVVRRRVD